MAQFDLAFSNCPDYIPNKALLRRGFAFTTADCPRTSDVAVRHRARKGGMTLRHTKTLPIQARLRGSSMIEMLGSLAIAGVMMAGVANQTINYVENVKDERTAAQLRAWAEAASRYVEQNRESISTAMSDPAVSIININYSGLTPYLASAADSNPKNAYGQQYCLSLQEQSPGNFRAFLFAEQPSGQSVMDNWRLKWISAMAGFGSGWYSPSTGGLQGIDWAIPSPGSLANACYTGFQRAGSLAVAIDLASVNVQDCRYLFARRPGDTRTDNCLNYTELQRSLSATSNVKISGWLSATSNVQVGGVLSTTSAVLIGGWMTVASSATINGPITAQSSATVTGLMTAQGGLKLGAVNYRSSCASDQLGQVRLASTSWKGSNQLLTCRQDNGGYSWLPASTFLTVKSDTSATCDPTNCNSVGTSGFYENKIDLGASSFCVLTGSYVNSYPVTATQPSVSWPVTGLDSTGKPITNGSAAGYVNQYSYDSTKGWAGCRVDYTADSSEIPQRTWTLYARRKGNVGAANSVAICYATCFD